MRTIANLRLASGSPRRAAILREAGFTFAVEPARDMELAPEEDAEPATVAVTLAATKAAEVAGRHREDVVLGADTLVVLGDRILGKPASPDDAAAMLRRLRARTHRVITGVAIEGVLGRAAGTRVTSVRFRRYTDEEVRQYIESGQPMDKAGAYGIQDQPFSPAESIQGCYLNVVGLPLCLTGELLEDIGAFAADSPRPGCPQCGHARST